MKIKLACFDFDGTLMENYSFSTIFRAFGLEDEFNRKVFARWHTNELTLADFDREAALLLKGLPEKEVIKKFALMKPMPGAKGLVDYLRSKNIRTAIITCAPPYFPRTMAEQIGIDWWTVNEYEVTGGVFTGRIAKHNLATPEDKARVMEEYAKKAGCTLKETAALGDSRIDLEMLKAAGLAIAVNSRAGEMGEVAKYAVDDLQGALEVFRKELEDL